MLLSSIKCLNHNIYRETLIVLSENKTCKGYYLEKNIDYDISFFDVIITNQINDFGKTKFILLSREDIIKLSSGDIIIFRPNGSMKLLYKLNSQDNALFVTEQCNNRCLMCSQPPRVNNDINYYYNLNTKLIDLLPPQLEKLGITGGEPTLLGNKLLNLLRKISSKLSNTEIHLLTNARHFNDFHYTKEFSQIELFNSLIGIPFHSDYYKDHDLITQAKGSYNETLKGIYNLARFNQGIELRIVINRVNYMRLPQISEYIFRNMPFVNHIAFMALEYTGYVPKNSDQIWIDPVEYRHELEKAVTNLACP